MPECQPAFDHFLFKRLRIASQTSYSAFGNFRPMTNHPVSRIPNGARTSSKSGNSEFFAPTTWCRFCNRGITERIFGKPDFWARKPLHVDSSLSTEIYDQTVHLLVRKSRDSSISTEIYDQTVHFWPGNHDTSISTELYNQTVQLLARKPLDSSLSTEITTKLSTFWPGNHETYQLVLMFTI